MRGCAGRFFNWFGVAAVGLGPALFWAGLSWAAEAPPSAATGYRLGPEDVLQVTVWRDETLTREVLVRPDGMISFPLIGELHAEGRTVDSLQKEIRERLVPFIPDPTVSVLLQKVNSLRIYVVGKVTRPGEYLVGHFTSVLQALSLAGGMTPFASENAIKVVRSEGGAQKTYSFRYGDVKKGKSLEQNILLERGDVVVVP